jgi:hypothetical protein
MGMRYLNTYKLFESMSDLAGDSYHRRKECIRTLEDMSLELLDENFNVQVRSEVLSRDDKYIIVNIHKKRGSQNRFDYSEIKDVFLSMVSYMESEGYSIKSIEVSDISSSNLIKYKLVDEVLFTDMAGIYIPRELNRSIGQLIIRFKE